MHERNKHPQYSSLLDALSHWPETATALGARLTRDAEIELLAPFGFSDLFPLIIAPSPGFGAPPDEFLQRVNEKRWLETWPRLRVLLPPSTDAAAQEEPKL